jgi:hypothetical protein
MARQASWISARRAYRPRSRPIALHPLRPAPRTSGRAVDGGARLQQRHPRGDLLTVDARHQSRPGHPLASGQERRRPAPGASIRRGGAGFFPRPPRGHAGSPRPPGTSRSSRPPAAGPASPPGGATPPRRPLRPIAQAPPAWHAGATAPRLRQHCPREPSPPHKEPARPHRPVGAPWPPALAFGRLGRSEGSTALPPVVGYKGFCHVPMIHQKEVLLGPLSQYYALLTCGRVSCNQFSAV